MVQWTPRLPYFSKVVDNSLFLYPEVEIKMMEFVQPLSYRISYNMTEQSRPGAYAEAGVSNDSNSAPKPNSFRKMRPKFLGDGVKPSVLSGNSSGG